MLLVLKTLLACLLAVVMVHEWREKRRVENENTKLKRRNRNLAADMDKRDQEDYARELRDAFLRGVHAGRSTTTKEQEEGN